MASRNAYVPPSSSTVKEYMQSRCIFQKPNFAIVVDGFRYVKPFKQLLYIAEEELLAPSAKEKALLSLPPYTRLPPSNGSHSLQNHQGKNEDTELFCISQADPHASLSELFCASPSFPVSGSSPKPSATDSRAFPVLSVLGNVTKEKHPLVLYFLSHFHSDHYTGISPTWHHGMIYCSEGTAAMVHSQLGVEAKFLYPLKMNQTYKGRLLFKDDGPAENETVLTPVETESTYREGEEERVKAKVADAKICVSLLEQHATTDEEFVVRMISSNHCPGAVMFLFYSPAFGGYLLHTGDFRFNGGRSMSPPYPQHSLGRPHQKRRHRKSSEPSPTSGITDREERSCDHVKRRLPSSSAYEEVYMGDDELLRAVSGKVKTLFLDNTFCAPAYVFPTQREVSRILIDLITSLFYSAAEQQRQYLQSMGDSISSSASPRKVYHIGVLIGSYTIGKERIALEVQHAFPVKQVKEGDEAKGTRVRMTTTETNHSSMVSPAFNESGLSGLLPIITSPSKLDMLIGMRFFESHFSSWGDHVNDVAGLTESSSPSIDVSSAAEGPCSVNTHSNPCAEWERSDLPSSSSNLKKVEEIKDNQSEKRIQSVSSSTASFRVFQPSLREPVDVAECLGRRSPPRRSPESEAKVFRALFQESNEEKEEQCSEKGIESLVECHLTVMLVPMSSIGYVTMRDAVQPFYAQNSPKTTHDGTRRQFSRSSNGIESSAAVNIGSKRQRESPSSVLTNVKEEFSKCEDAHPRKSFSGTVGLLPLESGIRLNLTAFDHVVAVEPTGFAKKVKKSVIGSSVTRISLPYSEHCSFQEMVNFVGFVNPEKVVPTVDVGQYKKYESLFLEKAPRLVPQYSAVPLTRMFMMQRSHHGKEQEDKCSEPGVDSASPLSSRTETDAKHNGEFSSSVSSSFISKTMKPAALATSFNLERRKMAEESEQGGQRSGLSPPPEVPTRPPRPPPFFLSLKENNPQKQKGLLSSEKVIRRNVAHLPERKSHQRVSPTGASIPEVSDTIPSSPPIPHTSSFFNEGTVLISISSSRSPSRETNGSDDIVFMKTGKRAFSISDDE